MIWRPPAGLLQPEGLLHAAVLAGDLRGVRVLCPAPAQQRDPALARPGGVEVAAVVEGVARPPPLPTQHQAAPHHLLGLQPEPEASTQQQTVLGVGPPAQRSPPITCYMDSPDLGSGRSGRLQLLPVAGSKISARVGVVSPPVTSTPAMSAPALALAPAPAPAPDRPAHTQRQMGTRCRMLVHVQCINQL